MPSSSKKRSSESLISPESPISSIRVPQFSQTIASSELSCPQALQGHKTLSLPTLTRQTCCRILLLTGHPSIPNTYPQSLHYLACRLLFHIPCIFSHFFLQSLQLSPIKSFHHRGTCSSSGCIPSSLQSIKVLAMAQSSVA